MKGVAFSSPSNTTSPRAPKYAFQLSIVLSLRGAVRPLRSASHTGERPFSSTAVNTTRWPSGEMVYRCI
jgi:hypothetical protein